MSGASTGALMEKEVATPEYYPLSLNALVNACNQKSDREPVSLGGNLVMNLVSRVPVHAAIVGAPAVMWFLGIPFPPPGSASSPAAFKNPNPDPETSRKNIEPIRTPVLILVGTADRQIRAAGHLRERLSRLLPRTAGPEASRSAARRSPVRFRFGRAGKVGPLRCGEAEVTKERG